MKKIAVIYHCFPHYRKAIVEALSNSKEYDYIFIGSAEPVMSSIKNMLFPEAIKLYDAPCKKIGPFLFQHNLNKHLKDNNVAGVILLGNAWYLSYWALCFTLILHKKPVLMWTHGWINKHENWFKKQYRNLFYKLADGLLLYGQRAKELGVKNGFIENNLHVIGNSLDFVGMSEIFKKVRLIDRSKLKLDMGLPVDKSIIVCSARLTPLCRFDLLIKAVAKINTKDFVVVLIGEGTERDKLQNLAKQLDVDVRFIGACYDEEIIARYYHSADMSVSPGKVGLTAIHSMTYGTPVISHNNLDKQGPEVEAILPGITGELFEYDDIQSLADEIVKWIHCKDDKPEIIDECRELISSHFSPAAQIKFIEMAITQHLSLK
jgi:glycosyltransferase involved in cell wall biosynthesis